MCKERKCFACDNFRRSPTYMTAVHQRCSRQTDGQTDRQHTLTLPAHDACTAQVKWSTRTKLLSVIRIGRVGLILHHKYASYINNSCGYACEWGRDCQLRAVKHGTTYLRHGGATATVHCHRGYRRQGPQLLACTNSQWNGTQPQCICKY